MVTLYVGGQKVAWADAEKVFAESVAGSRPIELRNDAGKIIARVVPEPVALAPDDPDWVKAITPEEIERRLAGPFLTLDEYRARAADTQAVLDKLTTGKPLDAETRDRIRRDAERVRDEIRQTHGVLDIGIPAIRELRDA